MSAKLYIPRSRHVALALVGATSLATSAFSAGRHPPTARHAVAPSQGSAPSAVAKTRQKPKVPLKRPDQHEDISVSGSRNPLDGGGGMMRAETASHSVQTVGRQYIEMRAPQSSVADLVRNVPSMNVATNNTSGITGGATGGAEIRSLTDADMTITMNGGPATGINYINQDIDSEDIDSIVIQPGSSPTDLPATSAAAGVLSIVTHNAARKFGGMADFSYGTNNMSREYIRLESGEIGNTHLRGYASFSNTHARSWMGAGINKRKNVDVGIQDEFDNGSNFKFFLSWNHTDAVVDNYATAEQFYNYKHTGNGFGRSDHYDAQNNNYWKNNLSYWNEITLSSPIHIVLPAKFSFDLTPYFNTGFGPESYSGGVSSAAGEYFTSSGASVPAGQSLTAFYDQTMYIQTGAVAKLGYDIDRHNHVSLGYWYENDDQIFKEPVNLTPSDGSSSAVNADAYKLYYANGSRVTSRVQAGYELHALFLEDHAKYLHDRLTIEGGLKYVMTNYWDQSWSNSSTGRTRSSLGLNTGVPLPHISAGYMINQHHQVYINAEGDFRQPSPASLAVNPNTGSLPKNQYAIKEELGYRYHDDTVIVDLSLFNYNITNRLLTTYVQAGQSATINAGNQTARGVDLMVSTHPIHGFSPYASVEYLHATMDSNIPLDGSYIHTKGNTAVMSPKVMANFGLSYTKGGFFGNFSLHYASSQSVTLAGDEHMPGYVTDTLSLGYRFQSIGFMKSPSIRLNFTNLTGSIVRTGPTGVTTNAHQVRLMNGSLSNIDDSSPNTFFVEPRFSMTGSVSTSF
ncbi:TonB-dependent receptor [Acetobacter nitrogenifigens DSM 23921 = NBRC 105050]|uniref:TonB-dependent receptor n=1 Tax=Acetobacter nitrogenifigens DSM 23921 = NBRC 105050 TaxID=1120919 RepID=A0A511XCK3_9PROT|nr:TonB-dependent receptor [Acetobacter nitrogenifigens]GBQ87906.1 TonB-dependent receptor [Acetobacter nitrogenifigens DSM 23921 = NBRC 105050]GEN60696.1 TonB-dependent receptor [Acetobacter nitrogenifigens DSM 23921 = NBRC 105050]